MVKLADIAKRVASDMVLRSSRRIIPVFIDDNQFARVNDPLCKQAEEIAFSDMEVYGVDIHPDLCNNE